MRKDEKEKERGRGRKRRKKKLYYQILPRHNFKKFLV